MALVRRSPFAGNKIKNMKTKFTWLAISGSLLLAAQTVWSQDNSTNSNSLPLDQTGKYQHALEHDRSLGERALLPPGLKEKLLLTDEQRTELKPIEDDFANTSEQYQKANQSRIDAALDAERQAREAKDVGRISAARHQLQLAWAGLQPYRKAALKDVKPLLTPDQIIVFEDSKNQWHETHGNESNDPSAQDTTSAQ
jgi:hypothetical protein